MKTIKILLLLAVCYCCEIVLMSFSTNIVTNSLIVFLLIFVEVYIINVSCRLHTRLFKRFSEFAFGWKVGISVVSLLISLFLLYVNSNCELIILLFTLGNIGIVTCRSAFFAHPALLSVCYMVLFKTIIDQSFIQGLNEMLSNCLGFYFFFVASAYFVFLLCSNKSFRRVFLNDKHV